jgi:hypothetical protein
MSEINSIQATEFDFHLQTSVVIDVPIITGTSHFFETSSPWRGITGMQFPVNNIPRQLRALLSSSTVLLPEESASLASHLRIHPNTAKVLASHSFLCEYVNGSAHSAFIC